MTERKEKPSRVIIPQKKNDYSDSADRRGGNVERNDTVITDTNPPPKPPKEKKE